MIQYDATRPQLLLAASCRRSPLLIGTLPGGGRVQSAAMMPCDDAYDTCRVMHPDRRRMMPYDTCRVMHPDVVLRSTKPLNSCRTRSVGRRSRRRYGITLMPH